MSQKRYVLVDGMALAYRSYYGVKQQLSTADGTPTNALFGFIRAVDQLRSRWQPTHLQVVFDGGIPERRRKLVPEYKAQRKPMPEEMRRQLPLIHEYLGAAETACLTVDGQEADDVLATLASRAADEGAEVLIATSDKDEFHIVNETISIISTGKEAEKMTPGEVVQKTGVRPDQIVDWLALTGDAADNIPGIPGVGGVTAAAWLQLYGNLEGILEHVQSLKPIRFREVLTESRALLEKNRSMVMLDRRVDCSLDWEAASIKRFPGKALPAFYRKYELNSLCREIVQPDLFPM